MFISRFLTGSSPRESRSLGGPFSGSPESGGEGKFGGPYAILVVFNDEPLVAERRLPLFYRRVKEYENRLFH